MGKCLQRMCAAIQVWLLFMKARPCYSFGYVVRIYESANLIADALDCVLDAGAVEGWMDRRRLKEAATLSILGFVPVLSDGRQVHL